MSYADDPNSRFEELAAELTPTWGTIGPQTERAYTRHRRRAALQRALHSIRIGFWWWF